MKTTTPRPDGGLWARVRSSPQGPPAAPAPVVVRLEMIGREHSGKTALLTTFLKGPLQGAQASGLELTAADPRIMNGWMEDALEAYYHLRRHGMVSTLEPAVKEYHLFRADDPRAVLQVREVVGQVLTHTTPDSAEPQQELYQRYVQSLAQADVLLVVMSCPPSADGPDLDRYEHDLLLHASYLREALRLRPADRLCAVVLTLAKIDTRFAGEDEARAALTDERLRTVLGRLVRITEDSARVTLAAIFPVTAFGFGNAVLLGEPADGEPADTRGLSAHSRGEAEWILRPDATPEPFNLTGLVWWALMAGLLLKPADGREGDLAGTARMLADDLKAMGAWFVPLKCRGANS